MVPELRDYHQINAELLRRLDRGETEIRLEGVEGQRLLVFGLSGPWRAVVEVVGNAGPELAAELNAPGVTVVCHGSAADGAGRGLRAGEILILGDAGTALGYFQVGGLIVCKGRAGPRPGLGQQGGDLVILDRAGDLAGERQRGGRLFLRSELAGRHRGYGRSQGRILDIPHASPIANPLDPDDACCLEGALGLAARFSGRT